ncbi:MAG: hypothetical protein IJ033_01870 [Clostridia bacterium]|nr:hypothetical protein [Clostridia bacterium]
MDDKVKFELTPIEEDVQQEKVVKASIEVVEEKTPNFSVEEVSDKEVKKEISSGVSSGNIKANDKEKPLTMGYVYGGIFIALGVGAVLIAFLLEGYKMPGIICAVLAFLAGYAMLKHVLDAKKIKALLDSGECKTVDELMLKLKRKNKYEFMRDLGGMIKAGYIAGYEVIEGNQIKKL